MEICTTWSLRCGEDIPPCITANHLSEEPEAEVQVEESHPFPHSPISQSRQIPSKSSKTTGNDEN